MTVAETAFSHFRRCYTLELSTIHTKKRSAEPDTKCKGDPLRIALEKRQLWTQSSTGYVGSEYCLNTDNWKTADGTAIIKSSVVLGLKTLGISHGNASVVMFVDFRVRCNRHCEHLLCSVKNTPHQLQGHRFPERNFRHLRTWGHISPTTIIHRHRLSLHSHQMSGLYS